MKWRASVTNLQQMRLRLDDWAHARCVILNGNLVLRLQLWLGGWVAGWLGGWVAGWLGGWVAGWLGNALRQAPALIMPGWH